MCLLNVSNRLFLRTGSMFAVDSCSLRFVFSYCVKTVESCTLSSGIPTMFSAFAFHWRFSFVYAINTTHRRHSYYRFLTCKWRGGLCSYRQEGCQASDHSSRLRFNIWTGINFQLCSWRQSWKVLRNLWDVSTGVCGNQNRYFKPNLIRTLNKYYLFPNQAEHKQSTVTSWNRKLNIKKYQVSAYL